MKFEILSFENGARIPDKYAFCNPADSGNVSMGANLNPHLKWSDAPKGTKSFAVICVDPYVPSKGDDVNQEGKTVPKDLARVNFYHWVLCNIPAEVREIAEGSDSDGVTPKGKKIGNTELGTTGINNYTHWHASNPDMAGNYGGYDGPCPPWNDSLIHHYYFKLYALNVEKLGLEGAFTGDDLIMAMQGHILAEAAWVGSYTLNKELL